MYNSDDNDHFRLFASSLEAAIEKYGSMPEKTLLQRQKQQVERLVALETKFRRTLIKHPWGPGVYKSFIHFITEEKRNILAARPYFRERQEVFTKQIGPALRDRAFKSLYRFHFNYNFIVFVLKARSWNKTNFGAKITNLAKEVADIRTEIVEMNMPLAISRARIFWSKTPKSHLSYMDLVQITAEGLMSAVDKFVLPYSRVFRAVAIGRILGNLIEQYSETTIHFYPIDKRKIYRANKLSRKYAGDVDYTALADDVNLGVDPAHRTNSSEIANLMAAASCVSADTILPKDSDAAEPGERFAADEANRPDALVEDQESRSLLYASIGSLALIDRKLLRLCGIEYAL